MREFARSNMRVVYVAGKYRGANAWEVHRNVSAAEHWAFQVATLGAMPLCPHTNTANFDGTLTDRFWLDGTMELLRRCDAIFLTPNWLESTGARGELLEAVRMRMPSFDTLKDLQAWILGQPYDDNRPIFVSQAEVAGARAGAMVLV